MEQTSHRSPVLNKFRRHPRVRISAPFVCALSRCQSRRWLSRPSIDIGVVYDLSIRGARVSTEAEIRPGDEVKLSLHLPKQIKPADIAVATVRWTKDQFFGLAFTKLSPAAQNRLKKYVAIASTIAALSPVHS
ncbi:MAG: PilZ domain-containing protein [Nitrospiraceae bacterium]|nr:PilZ domain-containing protein [Nitrospiraceae bacterium]